jgi:hypothetical protein
MFHCIYPFEVQLLPTCVINFLHHTQPNAIVSPFGAVDHVLFGKRPLGVIGIYARDIRGHFDYNIGAMDNELPSLLVNELPIYY